MLTQTKIRENIKVRPAKRTAVRYSAKIAETAAEIESALRLRFEVFNVELGNQHIDQNTIKLDFDEYDAKCRHLIVVETATGKTIGTYRINTLESAGTVNGFYAHSEFSIEDLPTEVLAESVEIGRACIAREHRNSRVLFLLWKGLADFLQQTAKRYLFGCSSIFTVDCEIGKQAFNQLKNQAYLHDKFHVTPRKEKICFSEIASEYGTEVKLPMLFEMYLEIGAKICGEPIVDREFGTIDFFVIIDVLTLGEKHRRMFFG